MAVHSAQCVRLGSDLLYCQSSGKHTAVYGYRCVSMAPNSVDGSVGGIT
jgi:hypothetical protein